MRSGSSFSSAPDAIVQVLPAPQDQDQDQDQDLTAAPVLEAAPVLSAQAVRLHAAGLDVVLRGGTGGLIGRAEAERLAEQAGALVEELTEVGLWVETDLSYVIRAAAPDEVLRGR